MGWKDNPITFMLGKFWEYSKGNRKAVVTYYILFFFANVLILVEPLILVYILNVLQNYSTSEGAIVSILFALSLILVLELMFWALHGPGRVMEQNNAFYVRAKYKEYLLKGTMDLPLNWHTDHHSGDTIDKIEKATRALYNFSTYTSYIIRTLMAFIGSYIALVYFNVHSTYIVLVMIVVVIWIILKFDKVLIKQYKELNKAENKISERIYDSISNITTVIILRIEDLVQSAIMKKVMKPFKLYKKNQKINETKWFLTAFVSAIMVVGVLVSYIYPELKAGNVIMVGTVYALYSYVERIRDQFFNFAYRYSDIVYQRTAVMNVEDVEKEFKSIERVKQVELGKSWKTLRVEGLEFSYNKGRNSLLHLDGVSLSLHHGERVAFIGPSGSGKTTMLKVIRELYHPRKIKLFLDGKKVEEGFKAISEEIALIPQDPEIFNATIKENITMGVRHNLITVKNYTDMAQFTEVVRRLPKQLNSSIVEKGVNLSGGEKQRLALARGLLACEDKSIILLDEPTSSVDFKNEWKIYINVFKSFKDKTIISSVHRLHLLPLFDTIYMFDNGKVLAYGSFEEIMESSREFRELWKKYNKKKNLA